jgi:hypothetical protein
VDPGAALAGERDGADFGRRLTAGGAGAQVAGIGIDAWLHARDPGLAARESAFSLDNVGHVLLLTGIALVAVGVVTSAIESRRRRQAETVPAVPPRRRALEAGAVLFAAVALSGTTAAAATRFAGGHSQAAVSPAATVHNHTTTGATVVAASSHSSGHGDQPSIPALGPEEGAALDSQLALARATALRYPTVADARAAGYKAGTPYESMIGSHEVLFAEVDGAFEITRPEMLLYDGDDPASRIVGLSYYFLGSAPPDGFVGKADRWHQHRNTCLTPDGPVFAGDGYRQCRSSGRNSWMLHAWVVPGYESPQGVFSDENARLS